MTRRIPLIRTLVLAFVGGTIAFTTIASAQASSRDNRPKAGRGFFEVGYMKLDLTELNAALEPAGFPALDDQFLTLGGAGFGEHGRFLIGAEGKGLLSHRRSTTSGSFDLGLGGGYAMFRVGYKAVAKRAFDVYPSFGLGGGGMQLDIRGRSAPTFGGILANPARSSRLTTGSFLLGLGVDANYRVRLPSKRAGEVGGLLLGASAGYLFSPGTGEWKLDDINSVAGGPAVKLEGFYAQLSIGGWGRKPGNN